MKEIGTAKKDFLDLVRLHELKTVAREMSNGNGFSPELMNQAMDLIREFSDKINEGKLVDAGKSLLDISEALYGGGRWGELREIAGLFPALTKTDKSLRNTMIQVSMYQVFRHDAHPDAMQTAKGYLSAAWDAKHGGTALPDEMLYLYKEEQDLDVRQPKGAELLRLANDFTDKEKLQFLNATGAHMNAQDLAGTPKAIHFAIEKVGKQVFEDRWRGFLTLKSEIPQQLLDQYAARSEGLKTLLDALRAKLEEDPKDDEDPKGVEDPDA